MDNPLDQTTLSTISLLESRILRLEHLLYGPTASHPPPAQHESVAWRMGDLEKRFSMILSRVRVYGHLLKIYCPVPDMSESTALVSMTERMKAIQAAQAAQAADMAELRRRSEVIIRSWYERSLLAGSRSMAEIESRVEGVERHVRRRERAMEEDKEI
ncbi:nuclear distribution protein [Ophiocordyceps sinensis CO18]|uniref:Nuclear distribution protein n=1 Tax=Ophiocordyceps sinensis (strain Co18 / CGMCC 3.14243) TaxID=911162 RepID=T5AJ87_OPHSC|nr:nuclear distribution protein [Ophiocordyceps sinensis CO18]